MRVAFFSSHAFDRQFFDEANTARRHDLHYLETHLTPATCALAAGFPVVCPFVNDQLNAEVLARLASYGARMIALRSAGFNHVDLKDAKNRGFTVARVPAYSPHSVAEHTIALILVMNRKIRRAYSRVRDGNFALDGLLGCSVSICSGERSASLAPARWERRSHESLLAVAVGSRPACSRTGLMSKRRSSSGVRNARSSIERRRAASI